MSFYKSFGSLLGSHALLAEFASNFFFFSCYIHSVFVRFVKATAEAGVSSEALELPNFAKVNFHLLSPSYENSMRFKMDGVNNKNNKMK